MKLQTDAWLFQEILDPFKGFHGHQGPVGLELSATDTVGKLEHTETWTNALLVSVGNKHLLTIKIYI